MAASELIAGISVGGDSAHVAVVEYTARGVNLHFLGEERKLERSSDFWYLAPLFRFVGTGKRSMASVNVAFDDTNVDVFTGPIDLTLTQSERNAHLQWELSHYVDGYRPQEYITDTHVLRSYPEKQAQVLFVVTIRRSIIFSLQKYLADRDLPLGIVDVTSFASANALPFNYPESTNELVILIGATPSSIECAVLRRGRISHYYRTSPSANDEATEAFLKEASDGLAPAIVFLYGIGITESLEHIARQTFACPIISLDPFRRLTPARTATELGQYRTRSHHFAAAVGIALRRP